MYIEAVTAGIGCLGLVLIIIALIIKALHCREKLSEALIDLRGANVAKVNYQIINKELRVELTAIRKKLRKKV